jgi:hypothetical protein
MSSLFWRILADITVTLHLAYVAFVILGQLLILIGAARGWNWIRSPRFRFTHLAFILIVVLESWIGFTCPLTTWEQRFRQLAGQATYSGDFIAKWLHELLFFDAPPIVFTICYTVFGLIVVGTFWLVPPGRRSAGTSEPPPARSPSA